MRMKLNFTLENELLDVDFRPCFVSFTKKCLQEKDMNLYKELYAKEATKKKKFTFSFLLPGAIFQGETVKIAAKTVGWTFSTADTALFIRFYNAFLQQKNRPFPLKYGNAMTLRAISLENEVVIKENGLMMQLLSPLVVRNHHRDTNSDKYYIFSDAEFAEALKVVTAHAVADEEDIIQNMVEELQVKAVNCHMVVVKTFGGKIPATLGHLFLKGHPKLLKYLYDSGIGSRSGEGFGMLKI